MLLISWFTGLAVGVIFLGAKPWFPEFATIASQIYARVNIDRVGKMFVANTMPGRSGDVRLEPAVSHDRPDAGGCVPELYPAFFPIPSIGLGRGGLPDDRLVIEGYTRKHASISWSAGAMRWAVFCLALCLALWPALADADDFPASFRVTGVAADVVLNIRAAPEAGRAGPGRLCADPRGCRRCWACPLTAPGAGAACRRGGMGGDAVPVPDACGEGLPRPLTCLGTETVLVAVPAGDRCALSDARGGLRWRCWPKLPAMAAI